MNVRRRNELSANAKMQSIESANAGNVKKQELESPLQLLRPQKKRVLTCAVIAFPFDPLDAPIAVYAPLARVEMDSAALRVRISIRRTQSAAEEI
jgi:hypothetical protein